tara:strand:+ start:360 stop:1127 length:768 start_codon:yes stop_codon:yes gene_type:complete
MLGLGNSISASSYSSDPQFALTFDGTGDALLIDDIQTILRDSFTINHWFRIADSTPSAYNFNGFFNTSGNFFRYGINNSGGTINYGFAANGEVSAHTQNANPALSGDGDSGWYMLTFSVSKVGLTSTIKVYTNANHINGTDTINGLNHGNLATGGLKFGFGAATDSSGIQFPWTGKFDEIAIWTAALDDDAITALYGSGTPLDATADSGNYDNSSDLVRYYKCNEGSGTSVVDATGNFNGTLQADATYTTDNPYA